MNQKIAVGVVYVAALFMAIMDVTIVNVALPVLGRDFHTSPDAVDSVVIAFLVSTGVFLAASGWLGDRFGGRKVLLFSVVLFTGSSALCGLAGNLGELVVFRVLQGAAGGLMTPVGMAMLFRVFPPEERVRASSILMIPTALAPALGPVLGGLLVTDLSWRWVFYVNLPIGIAAVVFGALFLDDHSQVHPGPFDLAGFLLAAGGLGLVMYGVSEGPLKGWGSTAVVVTIAAGAALLAAMVFVELRKAQPLLDLRVYGNRLFRSTSVVLTLGAVAFLGVLFLVALFYQDGLHLTALQSGLNTFPEALGVMIGAQVVSRRLYPVFGPRRIMASGLVLVAVAMAGMAAIGAGTSLWWARALMLVIGLGMSCVFIPAQAASFATISRETHRPGVDPVQRRPSTRWCGGGGLSHHRSGRRRSDPAVGWSDGGQPGRLSRRLPGRRRRGPGGRPHRPHRERRRRRPHHGASGSVGPPGRGGADGRGGVMTAARPGRRFRPVEGDRGGADHAPDGAGIARGRGPGRLRGQRRPRNTSNFFFRPTGTGRRRSPRRVPTGSVSPTGEPRPVMRTFTPRRFEPETATLQVDFVLHGEGPASAWAQQARWANDWPWPVPGGGCP